MAFGINETQVIPKDYSDSIKNYCITGYGYIWLIIAILRTVLRTHTPDGD